MYDYKKAFEGSALTAQEQYELLDETIQGIYKMIGQLNNECRYCPTCKKRYFKKDCHSNTRKVEKTVCLNPLTGGYLDNLQRGIVFNDTQSLAYFQLRLQKDGIMDMFKAEGVQDGDIMHFGALEYEIYF